MIRLLWRYSPPTLVQRRQRYLWAGIRFYSRRVRGRFAVLMLARLSRDSCGSDMNVWAGVSSEVATFPSRREGPFAVFFPI